MKPALLAALALLSLPATAETLSYTNPLWDGYLADPHAFKVGDTWYAVGTGEAPDGRQFPILRSENFTDWEFVAGALAPLEGIRDHWAPEIVEHRGKFFLHFAANGKMRVAVADKPEGPYEDQGKDLFPDLKFNIDGHVFKDPESGKIWLFFAKDFFDRKPGTALAAVELEDDMRTTVGEPQTILRAHADWQIYQRDREMYGRTFEAWYTVEGPAVIRHDGKYHLFYSGGNWQTPGYGVGHAASDTLLGPYADEQSVERASVIHTLPGKLIGPGHNSLVLGPDGETWFNVYHSWNDDRTKRQMCMDPLVWTADGPVTHQPSRGKKTVELPLKP